MIYNKANFWREPNDQIWHSLSRHVPGGGTTDLVMGPVDGFKVTMAFHQKQYEKMLAWAKSHRMEITDTAMDNFSK